jgi:putative NADH-flavin reductase
MSEVLIIGASSGIGLACTRQALEKGHHVRAFARSADKIALEHAHLHKINGDALNPADVAHAVDGVDAVIVALGVKAGPELIFGTISLFSTATQNLLPAMKAAGVKRLICVTGFGAGESRQAISCLQRLPFKIVFDKAYSDKSIQEELIKESGLDWVIARPGVLTNRPMTNNYQVLVEPSQWRNGVISRADVAHFLVEQIDDDNYIGTAPVLIRSAFPF